MLAVILLSVFCCCCVCVFCFCLFVFVQCCKRTASVASEQMLQMNKLPGEWIIIISLNWACRFLYFPGDHVSHICSVDCQPPVRHRLVRDVLHGCCFLLHQWVHRESVLPYLCVITVPVIVKGELNWRITTGPINRNINRNGIIMEIYIVPTHSSKRWTNITHNIRWEGECYPQFDES